MGHTGRRLVGAVALVVLSAGALLGPLGGAAARAEDIREPLPFLGDDAGYPDGCPEAIDWPARIRSSDVPATEQGEDARTRPDVLPVALPIGPDVGRLLAPFDDLLADDTLSVNVPREHPERERIQRLLAAVRVGYARDIRVEIVVDLARGAAAEFSPGAPTAASVLASGQALRVDTMTRAGALVFDDARREIVFPSSASIEATLVTPEPVSFRVGPRLAFTVTPVVGGEFVLDLDLHLSRAAGPRVLDEGTVRRAAPIVEVLAVRAAIPLVDGRPALVELPGARVAVRVSRALPALPDRRALPKGIAVVGLPAYGRALFAATPFTISPRGGTSEDDEGGETEVWQESSGTRLVALPPAWAAAAARTGVRLAIVPPALAVAEGDPAALALFTDALRPLCAIRGARVVAPTFSLPIVEGTPWTLAHGRLDPVRRSVDAEATYERYIATTRVSYEPLGTFVHGTPAGTGAGSGQRVSVRVRSLVAPDAERAGTDASEDVYAGALDPAVTRTSERETVVSLGSPRDAASEGDIRLEPLLLAPQTERAEDDR